MALSSGTRLAHYEVLEPIGKGGMGEVYRARDTRLERLVAIKVLPDELARDDDRLARFEREAKLLAALQHDNITPLFGLEEENGRPFLVMELVEGETLAERIHRGRLALREALALFAQIAKGLEAAHDRGILHRDLKPANVMITEAGKAKILDFGLAKAFARRDGVSFDESQSPTLTKDLGPGSIVGTAAYMSPEQARGGRVDKRTDIWAFGCCLYEALAGRPAFFADTLSDTIAAILEREPDWGRLPSTAPPGLVRLLQRCLSKEVQRRMRDIGDVRNALEDVDAGRDELVARRRPGASVIPWVIALLSVIVASIVLLRGDATSDRPGRGLVSFAVDLEPREDLLLGVPVLSPDGQFLAYAAGSSDASAKIYLRAVGDFRATPLEGTEGAKSPFFSYDGQWIGFSTASEIKRVARSGGGVQTIERGTTSQEASWGRDDRIVFQPDSAEGLRWIDSTGGAEHVLTEPDESKGEGEHSWPFTLPGGDQVLFTVVPLNHDITKASVEVVSMETGARRVVLERGYSARYVDSGHIVYANQGLLFAAPFDLDHLAVTGDSVPVLEGIRMNPIPFQDVYVSLSRSGDLAYVPRATSPHELAWLDLDGYEERLPLPPRNYFYPRLSPNGEQIAVWIDEASSDIWLYDIPEDQLSRFTFEGRNILPIWSPDGKWIAFASDREGFMNLYAEPADRSAPAVRLTEASRTHTPHSWTPDGPSVAYLDYETEGFGIWLVDRTKPLQPARLWSGFTPMFSPDGRWLAYGDPSSDPSEIYVRPFPGSAGPWQVSTSGGEAPLWSKDGRVLYYREGDNLMAVDVETEPAFSHGAPRVVLPIGAYFRDSVRANYDVTPDGRHFLMVKSTGSSGEQIRVVLNWSEELERRLSQEN